MKLNFKTILMLLVLMLFTSCGTEEEIREVVRVATDELNKQLDFDPRADLIINGSFEEDLGLGENRWGLYNEIPGWKADLENQNAPIEVQYGIRIGGIAPSHGRAKLELDSDTKDGHDANDAHVYQDIQTDGARTYLLSFDYAPRTAGSSPFEVYWDGELIAEVNEDILQWYTMEIEVDGTDSETRLEFRALSDGDSLGAYLDNISLKAIK
jgi:hypothetical protein